MGLMGYSPTLEPCGCGEKKRSGLPGAASCQQKLEIAYATSFGLRLAVNRECGC